MHENISAAVRGSQSFSVLKLKKPHCHPERQQRHHTARGVVTAASKSDPQAASHANP
jgi:hypothetical protein